MAADNQMLGQFDLVGADRWSTVGPWVVWKGMKGENLLMIDGWRREIRRGLTTWDVKKHVNNVKLNKLPSLTDSIG